MTPRVSMEPCCTPAGFWCEPTNRIGGPLDAAIASYLALHNLSRGRSVAGVEQFAGRHDAGVPGSGSDLGLQKASCRELSACRSGDTRGQRSGSIRRSREDVPSPPRA